MSKSKASEAAARRRKRIEALARFRDSDGDESAAANVEVETESEGSTAPLEDQPLTFVIERDGDDGSDSDSEPLTRKQKRERDEERAASAIQVLRSFDQVADEYSRLDVSALSVDEIGKLKRRFLLVISGELLDNNSIDDAERDRLMTGVFEVAAAARAIHVSTRDVRDWMRDDKDFARRVEEAQDDAMAYLWNREYLRAHQFGGFALDRVIARRRKGDGSDQARRVIIERVDEKKKLSAGDDDSED